MAGTLRAVTDATFSREVLDSGMPVLVDFWARWCGPCGRLEPVLEAIAAEHGDKLHIVRMDVDENPATAMEYGVTRLPEMHLFHGGKDTKTIVGALSREMIERDLAEFI